MKVHYNYGSNDHYAFDYANLYILFSELPLLLNSLLNCVITSVTSLIGGLSILNEAGGLRVFFPRNSFVTNTTLTHTGRPRSETPGGPAGNDHIVCYGGSTQAAQVTWHNSSGGPLSVCHVHDGPATCTDCGGLCQGNGGVGVDPPLNGHTDIHMYTNSIAYVNQELECQVSGGQSAFIGVYLVKGSEFGASYSQPYS